MIKLYRARSLLYRRQNLQENIRWNALDEIYKITRFCTAQTSTSQQIFIKLSRIFGKIFKNYFQRFFIKFCSDLDEELSEVCEIFEKNSILNIPEIFEFPMNSNKRS